MNDEVVLPASVPSEALKEFSRLPVLNTEYLRFYNEIRPRFPNLQPRSTLEDILAELSQFANNFARTEFFLRAAQQAGSPEPFMAWVRRNASERELREAAAVIKRGSSDLLLFNVYTEPGRVPVLRVRAVLMPDNGAPSMTLFDRKVDEESLEAAIIDALTKAQHSSDRLRLQFRVDYKHFCAPFDQMGRIDEVDQQKTPIGELLPLTIRWRDRMRANTVPQEWQAYARRIRERLEKQRPRCAWLDVKDANDIRTRLMAEDCEELLAAKHGRSPLASGGTLDYALAKSGAPFACWLREAPKNDNTADRLKQVLEAGEGRDFWRIPEKLREARRKHAGDPDFRHITLFWDDPDEHERLEAASMREANRARRAGR
ncbi:MAG: hypothetical protein JO270_01845 [Acidobacteriaceae bacterium]|nr:hypothetical protein [Acidobacteriaceae bacterium]